MVFKGSIFSTKNFKLMAISIILLVIGYILLGQGPIFNPLSWTIAPLLLVAVYCILLPWAIITKDKDERNAKSGNK